jgi:hypothetical protein
MTTTLGQYSRYWATAPYKGVFIGWTPIDIQSSASQPYTVTEADVMSPDLICAKVYGDGTEDLFWVLLWYNRIADPFSLAPGMILSIPSIDDVRQAIQAAKSLQPQVAVPVVNSVPNFTPVQIQPFVRLIKDSTATDLSTPPISGTRQVDIQFEIPPGLSGATHFQLELSSTQDFASIVLSRLTYASVANWYYYDPGLNFQAGGFAVFPVAGIDGVSLSGQQVYYHTSASDGLVVGNSYYARVRAWVNQRDQDWIALPQPVKYL